MSMAFRLQSRVSYIGSHVAEWHFSIKKRPAALITALERQRQAFCEFKGSVVYIGSSRIAGAL